MIKNFFNDFIRIIMGGNFSYNSDVSYILSMLFIIACIFPLLVLVFGGRTARGFLYIILVFTCLLVLAYNGGALAGLLIGGVSGGS